MRSSPQPTGRPIVLRATAAGAARTLALVLIVVVATGCTAGWGRRSTVTTPHPASVTIGVLAPLSGPSAQAGQQELQGAKLAATLVNTHSQVPLPLATSTGMPGLGGARLQLVAADTASLPTQGAAQAARLVTDQRVVGLVGAYDAAVTAAASARTERLGVPFVNGDTPAGYLTELGEGWLFRTGPTDRRLGATVLSMLTSTLAANRATAGSTAGSTAGGTRGGLGVVYADNDTGNGLLAVLQTLASEADDRITTAAAFLPGGDVHPALEHVIATHPDALLLAASTPADAASLLAALPGARHPHPQGQPGATATLTVAMGPGFTAQVLLHATTATGGPVGVARSAPWSLGFAVRNPAARAVAAAYQRQFGVPMTDVAAGSFTAVLTLAQAINQAASTDPQRIRVALLGLDVPGRDTIMPWDGIRFDETGQNALAAGLIEQPTTNPSTSASANLNGRLRVVFPSELASPT